MKIGKSPGIKPGDNLTCSAEVLFESEASSSNVHGLIMQQIGDFV